MGIVDFRSVRRALRRPGVEIENVPVSGFAVERRK
jgi:hypothetical protein